MARIRLRGSFRPGNVNQRMSWAGRQENQGDHQEPGQRGVQVSGGLRPGDLGDSHGEHEHAENGDHDAPPFRWPRAAEMSAPDS